MNQLEAIAVINRYSQEKIPFLFMVNYETSHSRIIPISEINPDEILFYVNGFTNAAHLNDCNRVALNQFTKKPIAFSDYKESYNKVMHHLLRGDSYLTNLTCTTPIECNLTLRDIFLQSEAKYRLYVKDEFVVFSPEIFIQIKEGTIYSFPMKGTIDAQLENAEYEILTNKKESAEHATIVDLIRNDLSKVATNVKVEKYRYIDVIKTNEGKLLQVSSKISGILDNQYRQQLGNIIFQLLPAGSISGAPKEKTLEIIASAETHKRGFYTGVFGVFDGKDIDSGVLIRFIEKQQEQLVFKSGGGITANSSLESEYQEMIQKVYLPF
ncbi:MAG: aminodeoxychorismate synthase component I [Salinivirgaceae bacterium]|jgi:para-aminobenzoate synthetase component 1